MKHTNATYLHANNAFLLLFTFILFAQQASAQTVLAGLTSNGGPDGKGTAFNISTNGSGFSILQSLADYGQLPNGSLLKGNDGYFYGMTSKGGTYGYGSIFKMSATGAVTILRELNYTTDGGYPDGELIRGADGLYYGMTLNGGLNGYGTIFKISSSGAFTIIRNISFTDGANPHGHLTLASDGNFYGITYSGGAKGYGTIFKLAPNGTYTILHSMNGTTEGGNSFSSLTEGKDGNLYGVTYTDATNFAGTIFKVTKAGALTVLRNLKTADGTNPKSDLIQATDGNFYGTCYRGGTYGNGTIFKITPAGGYTVIKNLAASTDGGYPNGSLMQNTDGALYGMMAAGGAHSGGTIYKLTLSGTYTVIHSLDGTTEGSNPNGELVKGNDASLYALASSGGTYNMGTAFKVTTAGAVTRLVNLNGATMGNAPQKSLTKGKDSAYYFTTSTGGAYGAGTIIKMCGGTTSLLFSFNKYVNGGTPKGSLLQASDGNLYGTASEGGTKSSGVIFKITPAGVYSVLRHLDSKADGAAPLGGLIQASDGFLYGMNSAGGANGGGTIFKISLTGAYTVLRHLTYATDGAGPQGDLVQASDGNLYGINTNGGKIFKLTLSGTFTVIHTLTGSEGSNAMGSLIQGKDGNLYGTCSDGGTYSSGTIFQVTLGGTYKVIRALNATPDGRMPKGSLLKGPDGVMYGMNSIGGTYNTGTVFKITTTGTYTVLRHLNLTTDGGTPYGSLIFAPVNNLVANAQSVTTNQDKAIAITLSGSGSSTLNYTISSQPKYGTLSGTGATRTYTPNAGYSGRDSFYFRVGTGCMASAPAKVSITVKAASTTGLSTNTVSTEASMKAGNNKVFSASLYPNPVHNTCNLQLTTAAATIKVTVADTRGSVVLDKQLYLGGASSTSLNVAALTPGMYFLTVQTAENRQTIKFIKQ